MARTYETDRAQRAATIARRKEVREAFHPDGARKARTLGGKQEVGFASDTSRVTGESKRRLHEHVARAAALGPKPAPAWTRPASWMRSRACPSASLAGRYTTRKGKPQAA